MVNGFGSLLLGICIRRHFPESAFWVIGRFVGIDMIFSAWSWVMLAIGVRGASCRRGVKGRPSCFAQESRGRIGKELRASCMSVFFRRRLGSSRGLGIMTGKTGRAPLRFY
jgi:hypothetical protein